MAALIRVATAGDFPRLANLLFQLSALGETPDAHEHPFGEPELRALGEMDGQRGQCLVLEVDGRVEGTLTLYMLPNLSHGGRSIAVVESVVVDADAKRCGYGRLLMEHAEACARAAGCYKMALMTNRKRDAEAHRFYSRLGYNPTHQVFTKYFDSD